MLLSRIPRQGRRTSTIKKELLTRSARSARKAWVGLL